MNRTYQRIEQRNGYQNITFVTGKGVYLQYNLWPDGQMTHICIDELSRMGWASVAEFLRHRRGFEEVTA